MQLMVLGHGAAGKTSLLNALNSALNKQKIKDLSFTESTIGFDEIQMELPDKVRYIVFDFAGRNS